MIIGSHVSDVDEETEEEVVDEVELDSEADEVIVE
jgi:hypothetical protein